MPAVFRPRFGRMLAAAICAVCAVALVMTAVSDGLHTFWQIGPALALVAGAVWAAYWRPEVAVDDGGVRMVNVLRTIDLPWPSIERVDTKWALTLVTAYGKYTAWAAPTPGGLATARAASRRDISGLPKSSYGRGHSIRPGDVQSSPSGAAAAEVRRRWEALRDASHLDDPRLEFEQAAVTWHWPIIGGAAVLVLLAILGPIVG